MTTHIGLTDEDRNIFRRWPVAVQARYHKADRGLFADPESRYICKHGIRAADCRKCLNACLAQPAPAQDSKP